MAMRRIRRAWLRGRARVIIAPFMTHRKYVSHEVAGRCNRPGAARPDSLTSPAPPPNARPLPRAQMAELVDAPASGAGTRKGVEVRVLFWAPFHSERIDYVQLIDIARSFAHPLLHMGDTQVHIRMASPMR